MSQNRRVPLIHILICFLAGVALISITSSSTAAPTSPPNTAVKPVIDSYFGIQVTDNYRWLEDLTSPDTVAWFKSQSDYTNSVLETIPHRAQLLARISSLDSSVTTYSSVSRVGGLLFYQKLRPTDQSPKLYVRPGLHGAERLLFDPVTFAHNGAHEEIDYYMPSVDGKYVVVGASSGGSEDSVIYILNVATGMRLSEIIDRARFGSPSWLKGSRSFLYNRLPKQAVGADPALAEEKSQVFLHVLGTDPSSDHVVFGYGIAGPGEEQILPDDISVITASPVSDYLVGMVEHGVQNEITLYAVPADRLAGAKTPWKKLVDVDSDVTAYDVKGSTIFLLTHKGASRFKVMSMSLAQPDFAHARLLVAASKQVIQGVAVAQDGVYVTSLDGGIGKVCSVPFNGGRAHQIILPYEGTVADSSIDPRTPGAWFLLTGWTESALWYSFDPTTGKITDTGLKKKSSANFTGIQSIEVNARAADGVLIPLSIVFPKGLILDGSHPTMCMAYGSYGDSMTPGFDPTLLAWFEHGGVYAVAHVRGGGEFGEDWHNAGKGLTKPNTWNDLISCSTYLIDKGYTSPKRLAIEGGSAGGITVGRAATTRPDLFGVVLDEVGASDALRQQYSPNGPPNIPEFGDVTTPEGFKALYAMDAYQHVKTGVSYPAFLLTTGINDPRVAPWEPAKMTAALQLSSTSGKPILLRVDYDAGHGIGSDRSQTNKALADEWAFALWQLGNPDFQPGG